MRNERHDHVESGNDMSDMPEWAQEAIKLEDVELEYVLAQWSEDGRVWIAVRPAGMSHGVAFPLDDTDVAEMHRMISIYELKKLAELN